MMTSTSTVVMVGTGSRVQRMCMILGAICLVLLVLLFSFSSDAGLLGHKAKNFGDLQSLVRQGESQEEESASSVSPSSSFQTEEPTLQPEEASNKTHQVSLQGVWHFPASQDSRQATLRSRCSDPKLLEPIHKPRWLQTILVDDERRLAYCAVPKAGCSNMKRALVESSGRISKKKMERKTQKLIDHNARSASIFLHSYKFLREAGFKHLQSYPKKQRQEILDELFTFLVARNPWSRLLSAYRDKFEKKDRAVVKLFHKHHGRRIMHRYRKNATEEELNTGTGVKFQEFLQYVADNGRDKFYNAHWASIHQLCNPCQMQYKYIAKLETIDENFRVIMDAINGTQTQYPKKTLGPNSAQRKDPKDVLKEYYSQVDARTIARIRNLYTADFELFGYHKDINKI